MVNTTASPIVSGRLRESSDNLKSIPIVAYTTTAIITGSIFAREHQRLLDVMNKGHVCQKGKSVNPNFIQVFDLDMRKPNKHVKHLQSAYVQKSKILFIGEREEDSGTKRDIEHGFRKKRPIQTVVSLDNRVFEGHLHVEEWADLHTAINTDEQFLPMTDIKLHPELPDGCDIIKFAAVNKGHITYIGI